MSITLHAPQIILLALIAIGIGVVLAKHGEPKDGTYNVFATIACEVILITLLYWGGFFTQPK